MKKLIALFGLGLALAVSAPSFSGEQQNKMKGCNKEAKAMAMKGDERKAFMKKCLSKDYELKSEAAAPAAPATPATPAAASTQQDRMKGCSADARTKGLKGDERKAFMSSCLKG